MWRTNTMHGVSLDGTDVVCLCSAALYLDNCVYYVSVVTCQDELCANGSLVMLRKVVCCLSE